jgi:sugar lactone lactonase YvrE
VLALVVTIALAIAELTVSLVVGTRTPGYSDTQVNNPYGMATGPDGALYFCDLDNQRVRRFDPRSRLLATIAGNGTKGYTGDGGPATEASLNMPHEIAFDRDGNLYIAERDNHVIRRVDAKTRVIATVAGTGAAGFSGDEGPGARAQLRQPHSVAFDASRNVLYICDIGNHRIRRLRLDTGVIDTYAGTGEAKSTPDGAPVAGTPLNGPRTLALAANGDLYLALREGNAIFRIDAGSQTLHRIAGSGEQGFTGDGGPGLQATLAGPKGLTYTLEALYIADTENHAIRRLDFRTGSIATVLGNGARGVLARPHGVLAAGSLVYITDSENHRILAIR